MQIQLYYQKSKQSVLTLLIPVFLIVGIFAVISVTIPEVFDNDIFLIFAVIIIISLALGIVLFLYYNYAYALSNVTIRESGIELTVLKKRQFFNEDRFLPFTDIAKYSFENINGEYIEIKTRKNRETIRLLKRNTIFSNTGTELDEKYKVFCSELKRAIDNYNQLNKIGGNIIESQSFWKTKNGRVVGYFIVVLDLALIVLFMSGLFIEFSFPTIQAVYIIILTLPILRAIFKKEK